MRILVAGSGGAGHTMARTLRASPGVREVFQAPGNAGTLDVAATVDLPMDDAEQIAAWAVETKIDLVVPGASEAVLAGLSDTCLAAGLKTIGPTMAAAARLNDSEWIAHQVQQRGITLATMEERQQRDTTLVLLALADGTNARGLGLAQIYRRLHDGGQGPLTDGMGACSPPPGVPDTVIAWLEEAVVRPLITALAADGTPYRGFLFVEATIETEARGTPRILIIGPGLHPMATQAIVPRLKTDLLLTLIDAEEGEVGRGELTWTNEACCAVTLVSEGYPDLMAYETGYGIQGLSTSQRATFVAHEATRNPYAPRGLLVTPRQSAPIERRGGGGLGSLFSFGRGRKERADGQARRAAGDPFSQFVTGGGRVVTVVALSPSADAARQRAYEVATGITYTGRAFRQDIGATE